MNSVRAPLLFLLLLSLLSQVARSDVEDVSSRADRETMLRQIEEEMLLLNKSGHASRDKRALGILLQGFMEALGYTVTPIRLASLPHPVGTAAATPRAGDAVPPATTTTNASASAPARQRETIRFTGLLNFGNNENSTNLIDHLSRYEQMFHGNTSTAAKPAAAPAAVSGPDIDPRSRPPLKEPLFVPIPLPIVPNLPPPQPPSPMPLDHSYNEGSSYDDKDSSEDVSSSKDDEGQTGQFDEEEEDSRDSDDLEYKQEKYDNPEDRNYENKEVDESSEEPKPKEKHVEKEYGGDSGERPKEHLIQTEYKNNKNVENFTVENKEIHDPSEVDVEGPPGGSKFNHATFVDEPNWKEEQDAKIYKIAAEQEAHAEALAEENAEREKDRERNHEEQEEFHRNREKEIEDANDERDSSYQKKPYYEDDEDEGSSEKGHYEDRRNYDEDAHKEADHEENGTQRNEARAQLGSNVARPKNYQPDTDFYPATLPISYDRDQPPKDQTLRDSYGKSLEIPNGKVDERVAEYITMFKNPQTGIYDPSRAREYQHARISFDHTDLIDGFNRIQKEYGSPENKYEEYEIDGSDRVEHRSNGEHADESTTRHKPTECSCKKKKKIQLEMQGAPSTERSVTQPPPSITSTRPDTSYGPYYSTMKYLYDPLERDRGIISRLTTHDKPTTVRFENHVNLVTNRTTIGPTIPPDRLTTLSFLHEAESKKIRAWPAPFDYLYDNSERKSVVYEKPPSVVSMPAPFKSNKPSCNHHMMPFAVHRDKMMWSVKDGSADSFESAKNFKEPNSFHENRKNKPSEQLTTINKRVEYFPIHSSTRATLYDKKKRPTSNEKFSSYHASTKSPTRTPTLSDIITARPERLRSTRSPRKNRRILKHADQTIRSTPANIEESTNLPAIEVKYTYPYEQSQFGNVKGKTTNYVKKGAMLVTIPEPAPYHYHGAFGEFTEEPPANTEKIEIKEYRNHVASVEVAELKQLHPEGPMQFLKYTRNL